MKMKEACNEVDVKFVDNDANFTFRNGAADDAAFQRDGLHLSESGVGRLLLNLSLPEQPPKQNKHQQQHRHVSNATNHDRLPNARVAPDGKWTVVKRRTRLSMGKCAKCGETNHVIMWIKVMPKKTPRKFSCILVACLYYTPKTEYLKIRDHLITNIDTVMRKHPECGVIITGDFNQLRDNFMKTHYRFVQVVNVVTRGQAILDKIWTNMEEVYTPPVTISELGSSDHNMVLLKPKAKNSVDTGCVTRLTVRCMGPKEKATFSMALSAIKWEPLFRLDSCADQYSYYQTVICNLMEICFPTKIVTRHTADKPWVTDWFRDLVRKRQRAHMSGDLNQAKILRNKVNRAASKLKYNFYQTQIAAMHESGSHDWWKHMKTIMGLKTNGKSCMQGLANKTTDGDCGLLANTMNDFFVSVSDHLPRLNKSHKVFDVNEELPDQYVISVCTTFKALESVKANKATGPDNIPAWVLRNYANVLAPPLTAIFNNSLREGVLPMEWKMANVIPLPKTSPLCRLKKTLDQFH
ncbi:hypothetical protein NP493_2882g00005 [Ridgeia piscesae]|uniref:Endonuclease/exonuclease/phosphatase domain-containing protein n=1 Tax=Ridgeia piscesae TaxID=27915 RepID=A0AAD9MZ60_RIDPI|nr:hypothetical protein NP493_2882g00005 [Ridgeia piscesae]